MDHKEFEQIFEQQVDRCRKVLVYKAAEYATEDRLHNFRVAAKVQGETPREALGGMMAKHVVSVFDLIKKEDIGSLEMWDEKIGDTMNYLFLLKAIVLEEWQNTAAEAGPVLKAQDYSFLNPNITHERVNHNA